MPQITITVTGNCIELNDFLVPKGGLSFFKKPGGTLYNINMVFYGELLFQNITAADTTLNGTNYPTVSALFAALKTAVY